MKDNNKYFQISLKVIIKNKLGQMLLLKLPENSSMAGYYDFPGGYIRTKDINENFETVTKREIKEELGNDFKYTLKMSPISIGRHQTISKSDRKKKDVVWIFFEGLYKGGKIRISEEHTGYEWTYLKKSQLEKYFRKGALDGMNNYFKWNKF